MPDPTTAKELIAVLMPDGGLRLEWDKAEGKIGQSRRLLQNERYGCFEAEAHHWLLDLGFADTDVPLSPSLSYWRDFADHNLLILTERKLAARSSRHKF